MKYMSVLLKYAMILCNRVFKSKQDCVICGNSEAGLHDIIRGLISRTYLFVGYLEIVDFDFFYYYANLKLQNDRLLKDLICLAISSERKNGLVEQGQGQVLVGH